MIAAVLSRTTGVLVYLPNIYEAKRLFPSGHDVVAVLIHQLVVGEVLHMPVPMTITPLKPPGVVSTIHFQVCRSSVGDTNSETDELSVDASFTLVWNKLNFVAQRSTFLKTNRDAQTLDVSITTLCTHLIFTFCN